MTRLGKRPITKPDQAPALSFGAAWDYVPARESTDGIRIEPRQKLFIGGAWKAPRSASYTDTINPADEQKLAEVPDARGRDVDDAVRAARTAYDAYWSKMPGRERAKYIFRLARAIQDQARELCIVESMNGGKTIRQSRDVDLPLAAAHLFYHAGWADKLGLAFQGRRWRPLGVAAQISSWNRALLSAVSKVAPALACGNTVVLKPDETSPLTALLLARIVEEAELPPGVVNVVTGGSASGAALAGHAGVDAVAFTGAVETGKQIQRALAGSRKKLMLRLGGRSTDIIFADAPIDQAVDGIVRGIDSGQSAPSRLLVEESIAAVIDRKLRDRFGSLRVGDPLDKNTDVGAIHSAAQRRTLEEIVGQAEREGARRYSLSCSLPDRGYWFPPTLLTGVAPSSRLARAEVFGPVLAVTTFRTPDEAVDKANDTTYGLSATVWSDKGAKVLWVGQRLKAGVVWGNTLGKFDPSSPFGGARESGFGSEGGRQGLLAYTEVA